MGIVFLIVATVTNSLSYVFEKYFTKKMYFFVYRNKSVVLCNRVFNNVKV